MTKVEDSTGVPFTPYSKDVQLGKKGKKGNAKEIIDDFTERIPAIMKGSDVVKKPDKGLDKVVKKPKKGLDKEVSGGKGLDIRQVSIKALWKNLSFELSDLPFEVTRNGKVIAVVTEQNERG